MWHTDVRKCQMGNILCMMHFFLSKKAISFVSLVNKKYQMSFVHIVIKILIHCKAFITVAWNVWHCAVKKVSPFDKNLVQILVLRQTAISPTDLNQIFYKSGILWWWLCISWSCFTGFELSFRSLFPKLYSQFWN